MRLLLIRKKSLTWQLITAILLVLLLASCCKSHDDFLQTTLYFGLGKPDKTHITPDEWQKFVDEQVTPSFKDGLTIIDAQGQWQYADGRIGKGASKILIVIHPQSKKTEKKITEIINKYKKRFMQESVLQTVSKVKVNFHMTDTPHKVKSEK